MVYERVLWYILSGAEQVASPKDKRQGGARVAWPLTLRLITTVLPPLDIPAMHRLTYSASHGGEGGVRVPQR